MHRCAVPDELHAQGEGVTTGLRKVTDDMKSKNRADRSGVVPALSSSATPTSTVHLSAAGDRSTSHIGTHILDIRIGLPVDCVPVRREGGRR
jgi:hypothetical protein